MTGVNKGHGMCYPVWDDAYKRSLAANRKESPCGSSGFPLLLSEWSFTICLTPYNRKYNVLSASLNKTFPSFPYILAYIYTHIRSYMHIYITACIHIRNIHVVSEFRECIPCFPDNRGRLVPQARTSVTAWGNLWRQKRILISPEPVRHLNMCVLSQTPTYIQYIFKYIKYISRTYMCMYMIVRLLVCIFLRTQQNVKSYCNYTVTWVRCRSLKNHHSTSNILTPVHIAPRTLNNRNTFFRNTIYHIPCGNDVSQPHVIQEPQYH